MDGKWEKLEAAWRQAGPVPSPGTWPLAVGIKPPSPASFTRNTHKQPGSYTFGTRMKFHLPGPQDLKQRPGAVSARG